MELILRENNGLLNKLFIQAKTKNDISEWEFIQVIMNGNLTSNDYTADDIIDNPEIYKHLSEYKDGIQFERHIRDENINYAYTLYEIGNSFHNDYDKFIRMRLSTYCYVIEMDYLLNVVAELLWISNGNRFFPKPFDIKIINTFLSEDERKRIINNSNKNKLNTKDKYALIKILCEKTDNKELEEYIDSFYDNHIRNTFYHSRYIIGNNGYIGFDKSKTIVMSKEEIGQKIDKAIFFFDALIDLIDIHRCSYTKTINIKGLKMDYNSNNLKESKLVDVMIIANERIGIASTMELIHNNDSNSSRNDDHEFSKELINFMENYDSMLKDKK